MSSSGNNGYYYGGSTSGGTQGYYGTPQTGGVPQTIYPSAAGSYPEIPMVGPMMDAANTPYDQYSDPYAGAPAGEGEYGY